ncbi:hypothetical protein [Parachitinimonas caeni]|uniref:Uncharacterized protein n=1 Tax=Parachitinimonas caeni TaxID=3031301 RepID=A0ABT7DSM9_9NEIS|nr:hypothetical protein [Parachitinimonas caeni]MDK2123081.1 hypothetical protein [Parachitinimonas caeni]
MKSILFGLLLACGTAFALEPTVEPVCTTSCTETVRMPGILLIKLKGKDGKVIRMKSIEFSKDAQYAGYADGGNFSDLLQEKVTVGSYAYFTQDESIIVTLHRYYDVAGELADVSANVSTIRRRVVAK